MTKQYCDRCDAETTGKQSGHVTGIDDADEDGGGNITKDADLCMDCYQMFLDFLRELKPAPATHAVDPQAQPSGTPGRRETSS